MRNSLRVENHRYRTVRHSVQTELTDSNRDCRCTSLNEIKVRTLIKEVALKKFKKANVKEERLTLAYIKIFSVSVHGAGQNLNRTMLVLEH